nr:hypothetical protein [Tanacetum cinerariifolium]
VYPNPSAGHSVQLLLTGYDGEALTLRLTDNLGRLILTQQLSPVSAQYGVPLTLPEALASGTYVVTLAGNGTPVQKRLILSE